MLTLGIETSGRGGGVALVDDAHVLAERTLSKTGERHARTLALELRALLADCGMKPADVRLVAVSIGPGSFTGLRVGVVTAKTLAYAIDRPLVAVPTFDVYAGRVPPATGRLHVIGDALRGDLYLGTYRHVPVDGWTAEGPVTIAAAERWLLSLTGEDSVTGPGVERLASQLAGTAATIMPDSGEATAAEVARIGLWQFARGIVADAWLLEPLYVRRSAAEEKRDG